MDCSSGRRKWKCGYWKKPVHNKVARFSCQKYTKIGGNIPNDHKIYQNT
jgi:hypothetical protein